MANKEIWKDIEGYEGLYQVSNLGRVRSLGRYVNNNHNSKYWVNDRDLKKATDKYGYEYVILCQNNNRKTYKLHRLVAKMFIPNTENKREVNHKNGIKSDNRAQNLEWVTSSENKKHAYSNKLNIAKKGENGNNAKFTNEQVKQIRKEYVFGKKGYGLISLARKYGVHHNTISRIVRNERYKNT